MRQFPADDAFVARLQRRSVQRITEPRLRVLNVDRGLDIFSGRHIVVYKILIQEVVVVVWHFGRDSIQRFPGVGDKNSRRILFWPVFNGMQAG